MAALAAGLTGTWSPCGYSMLDTLGPSGHTGGRRTTIAACVTFVPGALLGGAVTFGLLGWLGGLLHGVGDVAYVVAGVIALLAAVADLRGLPIVPQIRRQLPEHWRRVMPMPVAAALYGVLLGLGFTTFVLSFGVWALAGISLALGDAYLGAAIGTAFGIGRALPIVVIAPYTDRRFGRECIAAMAERPALYRGARFGDGVSLAAVAALLLLTGPAASAGTAVSSAADPGIAGADLVYQKANRDAWYRHGAGTPVDLNGKDPAIGGAYVAVVQSGGESVELLRRSTLASTGDIVAAHVADVSVTGANAIAVSGSWLVWRRKEGNDDLMRARTISNPANPGAPKTVARIASPGQLSHPSIDGGLLLYSYASRRSNKIVQRSISSGNTKALASSTMTALQNPAVYGKKFLYVAIDRRRQRLLLRNRTGGEAKTLHSRKRSSATLNSTALNGSHAYVTLLGGGGDPPSASILKFSR